MRFDGIADIPGGTILMFSLGIGLTSWAYMWRTTPFHRAEVFGSPLRDSAPELPAGMNRDRLQQPGDGVGPVYHRRFVARVRDARMKAEQIAAAISADPNCAAPTEFVHFEKTLGRKGTMVAGDEYVVQMPGPWNGPVRVVEVTPTSFRLATLKGHLEAGQVEFRAVDDRGMLQLSVETWANSGDRVSRILYQHLRMAKEVQFHMWTSLLESATRLSGGRLTGGLEVVTREVQGEGLLLGDAEARRRLDDLHHRHVNYDQLRVHEDAPGPGWQVDRYRQALPHEAPGEPEKGGSWEVARDLVRRYEFADPDIIRAVYQPEHPLQGRDMLLEARFWGLTFHFGVRVGGVRDETTEIDGRSVRIWGWHYRTLQGHLEEGQMDFEVWKWLDTGQVEFCTRRFSRHAEIGNPLVRVGFRLFGRREQVRFARHACERMARLTSSLLEEGETPASEATAAEGIRFRTDAGGRAVAAAGAVGTG